MRGTRRVAAIVVALGGVLGAGLVGAQQRTPPPDGPDLIVIAPDQTGDVVVIDGRPVLRGGLWRFTRSGTQFTGGMSPSYRFSLCLPNDDLEDLLRFAANERSLLPGRALATGLGNGDEGQSFLGQRCGWLRLEFGKGRVTGRRSCTRLQTGIGRSHANLSHDVSGQYDAKSFAVTHNVEEQTTGIEDVGSVSRPNHWRWRVTGERVGACPARPAGDQQRLAEAAPLIFSFAATEPPL